MISFVTDSGEETVVGNFGPVSEGEMLQIEGEYTLHPVYGKQFRMRSYSETRPDDESAIIRYLGSGIIKGIGPTLAGRIVAEFGRDTFDVLEYQPERLAKIKGINIKKAREIAIIVSEKRGYRDALLFLGKYGIGNELAIRIFNYYHDEVYEVLKENPYRLAEDIRGIGFKTADSIAMELGIAADSDYRIRSGILYALSLGTAQGHMYLPLEELTGYCAELLSVPEDSIRPEISNLAMDRKIVIKEDAVYSAVNYHSEQSCAGMLRTLAVSLIPDSFARGALLREIDRLSERIGSGLDDRQKEAVAEAVGSGVSVITGGPGTGKTTTIKTIIAFFEEKGKDVLLAAPTGRAAKRMTEATGYEAKTIHRLLEVGPGAEDDASGAVFERNEDNPLEADAIIVDEMSMVDIYIFRALLKAVTKGTRLVLVGDSNQLPSVGPGQVLRDLIESGCFPVTRLERIYRQEGSGDIVLNAHRINKGEALSIDNGKSRDFFLLERDDTDRILANMVELISEKLPGYVGEDAIDIQVLTPARKGRLGVSGLNAYLQERLNPASASKQEHMYGENLFREGDKVMQIRNNYKIGWTVVGAHGIAVDAGMGVFNGDMGRIIEIDNRGGLLTVEFDDGHRVEYPFSELDELELAYAITVHKSQGSEYGAVIMPLMDGPRQLMNRNLLYTGVTRAQKCLVILGSSEKVAQMITNDRENLRYTGLKERISEIFACQD